MAEIDYKSFDDYLHRLNAGSAGQHAAPAPVYLIFGEALLRDRVLQRLLEALQTSSWNYEPLDGSESDVYAAIEKANTFSLLSGPKVVALHDVRLFDSGADIQRLIERARKAYRDRKLPQASTTLLRVLSLVKLKPEDTRESGWQSKLPVDADDHDWLEEVADLGRRSRKPVAETANAETALADAVEKGFATDNRLILISDSVDRRRKLYKIIRDRGVIIDCSVPRGERKVEQQAQQAVVQDTLQRTLSAAGKQLQAGAFQKLYEMTGFDLHTAVNNLEKLIDYVGRRTEITRRDIQAVLKRTRKDPVFALSNAVAERNLRNALFFTESLLSDSENPLQPEQVLVTIVNQVRKLLRIKDFLAGSHGKLWRPGCSYGHFKAAVMPAAAEFDRSLSRQLQKWEDGDETAGEDHAARRIKTDLPIVKNPNNPYPVYQQFLASDRYSFQELISAFEHLTEADRRIKSTTADKRKVLEEVLMRICLEPGKRIPA